MAFILLFVGAIMLVSALQATQADLATALETDIPGYAKWALAIIAIGSLGLLPGVKPISRALLALVFTVIVLKNYQAIITGFEAANSQIAAAPSGSSGGGITGSGAPGVGSSPDNFESEGEMPPGLGQTPTGTTGGIDAGTFDMSAFGAGASGL